MTQSVSSTGMRVTGARDLAKGEPVEIAVAGTSLDARVAWVSDTRIGLEFEVPQSRAALIAAGLRHP